VPNGTVCVCSAIRAFIDKSTQSDHQVKVEALNILAFSRVVKVGEIESQSSGIADYFQYTLALILLLFTITDSSNNYELIEFLCDSSVRQLKKRFF
jgi:hypothetical protein